MLRGPDPCSFYVIGGTTGHNFFLDVDKLSFSDGKWSWLNEAQAAMLRGPDPCSFYVIGGTTGHNFFLDVDKLSFSDGKWSWLNEAQATPNMEGRYRLEAVLHDDLIFLFGGGRPDFVTELRTITVFDTKNKTFVELPTLPDETLKSSNYEDGYPKGRRCHSVTKWKRKVILVGGCSADKDDDDVRHVEMYSDVWSFDLDLLQWTKMPFELAVPVFFHDAAITREGCLLVWGGVRDIYSSHRTNIGQYCYLEPPSLRTLAALALRPYIKYNTIEEADELRLSCVMEFVRGICSKQMSKSAPPASTEPMALSLLGQNRCSFGGCQQYFASTDDLIAHIEFTHIPSLEEEYRQKLNQAQSGTEENRASATPNLPLSCVYRLFRPAYNPVPCEPDVVRINFNHYRKRTHE
ncbi:unnamed protein product [Heligmosomoides polygyrus]|uniref:C2H2-type domain-containing protein n=1 Tax=Heligmosomoides polygyrus TaxID=6339 RepID=A0A183GNY3_HELPZ|nr:unnamed protein product [Heligmosomoides polygyrus]